MDKRHTITLCTTFVCTSKCQNSIISICCVFGVGLELKSELQQLVGFQFVVEQLAQQSNIGGATIWLLRGDGHARCFGNDHRRQGVEVVWNGACSTGMWDPVDTDIGLRVYSIGDRLLFPFSRSVLADQRQSSTAVAMDSVTDAGKRPENAFCDVEWTTNLWSPDRLNSPNTLKYASVVRISHIENVGRPR